MQSAKCKLQHARRSGSPAFTLIEMLVVLGIVALVAAITLPMVVPILRTRTLDSAVDTVKTSCNLARSMALQQRKMVNLTLLQQTDSTHGPGVVLTGYSFAGSVTSNGPVDTVYDINQNWTAGAFQYNQILLFSPGNPIPQVRKIQSNTLNTITIYEQGGTPYNPNDPNDPNESDWSPQPVAGNVYVVMSSTSSAQPYCIHYFGNYYNGVLGNGLPAAADDVRFNVMKTFSLYMGETIEYLPLGCQFDFTAGYSAWNSLTSYTPGKAVADKGIVYYCLSNTIGVEPPNANWQALTAWTYVFLPDGEAWTLLPTAQNVRDPNWFLTTCMSNGTVSGPKIWGPQNLMSATIVVYGTTGQVISQ
ncbi:MAG: prepilin-type N-terminal cleavage/methylation domain-containing protein [Candidatus Brocadiia bacterium]|jgi:prepilin-type N-terminal cleavage/methylation domain-containing protein